MKKIIQPILILAVIGFSVWWIGHNPQKAQAATTHISSCQTLSAANTTYVLDNDVSSTGTCFTATAANISFDLNGHTVTYDTDRGNAGGNFAYAKNGFFLQGGADNFILTNSVTGEAIIQQGGNPDTTTSQACQTSYNTVFGITSHVVEPRDCGTFDSGVFVTNDKNNPAENVVIGNDANHPITFIYNGRGSGAITSETGSATIGALTLVHLEVKYITTKADVREKSGGNTQEGAIILSGPTNNTEIQHNVFTYLSDTDIGGMSDAITVYGANGLLMHDNTYHHKTPHMTGGSTAWDGYKNPYAIIFYGEGQNVTMYNEKIDFFYDGANLEVGRGIMIDGTKMKNFDLHNNDVKVLSIGNSGDLQNVPVVGAQVALRLRGTAGEFENFNIHDNTFVADGAFARAVFVGWDQGVDTTRDITFKNNILRQINTYNLPSDYSNCALELYLRIYDYGIDFENNTFDSVANGILFYQQGFLRFNHSTIIKPADAIAGWHSIEIETDSNTSDPPPTNIYFIDTVKQGWSDWIGTRVLLGGYPHNYSYSVQNSLNLIAKDANGNPVSGAGVTAVSGKESVTATTDQSGNASLVLTDFQDANMSKISYTPHAITISKTGVGQAQTSVMMDKTKSLEMILSPGPSIVKQIDKTSASSGDTLTYTINYSNPTQTTYSNVKIEDPIPSGTTYIDNSATGGATLNNGKIELNIGSLAPNASGSISFQVRVN